MKISILSYLLIPFLFTGCAFGINQGHSKAKETNNQNSNDVVYKKDTQVIHQNLTVLAKSLSEELLLTHTHPDDSTVVITSFVNVNQLNSTSDFGRIMAEHMISELHKKGFKVKEYRGQNAISINADGEFHITRDIKKLSDTIEASYILIGTYSKINDNIMAVNARIVDFENGEIYATASGLYTLNPNANNSQKKSKNYVEIVRDN